jgi:hypothetical protein
LVRNQQFLGTELRLRWIRQPDRPERDRRVPLVLTGAAQGIFIAHYDVSEIGTAVAASARTPQQQLHLVVDGLRAGFNGEPDGGNGDVRLFRPRSPPNFLYIEQVGDRRG